MKFEDLKKEFYNFKEQHGKKAYNRLNEFLDKIKVKYLKFKTNQYVKNGYENNDAHNRARQSWRTFVGHSLQKLIYFMLQDYFENTNVKFTQDSKLKKNSLSEELDIVRRMVIIHFDKYSFLPDSDIIIYKYDKKNKTADILCIISIKNSFRERGYETTYWKLKLEENKTTENIKVFLVTPDKSDEISFIEGKRGVKKTRVILEYELDGIYIAKKEFKRTSKVFSLERIFKHIERLM